MKQTKVVFSVTYIAPADYASRGITGPVESGDEPLGCTEFDFTGFTPSEATALLVGALLETLSSIDHGEKIAAVLGEIFSQPLGDTGVEVVPVKPTTN